MSAEEALTSSRPWGRHTRPYAVSLQEVPEVVSIVTMPVIAAVSWTVAFT